MPRTFFLALLVAACRVTDAPDDKTPADVDTAAADADGDGFTTEAGDCDDHDNQSWPGALELCNGRDDDCDGAVDEAVTTTYYADADGDGFGDAEGGVELCAPPAGFVDRGTDCNDADANSFPGAPELCDELDNDCDGEVDEGAGDLWYADADADGFGDSSAPFAACDLPESAVANDDDCDDNNADAFPGGEEVCDSADNDCDGTVDEGVTTTFYVDLDGDGFGVAAPTQEACSVPTGYADNSDDCDDLDASVNPDATELCNGVDDDCDGGVDEGDAADAAAWYADADGDGFGDPSAAAAACDVPFGYVADNADCDDSTADVHPGAAEVCNGVDDDCDGTTDGATATDLGTWYLDYDGDGYGGTRFSTTGCEAPAGYVADATDCDDADDTINPAASEACNGLDDNCDGDVDEGLTGLSAACPAEDCAEILSLDPTAATGNYYLDPGIYYCDMTTDGGGWTRVKDDLAVYGTGYDTTYYNSEGFTWTEALFAYGSGSATAHCTYPSSLTGCNNLGFQFASESWGVPLYWGSSICGMATTDYTGATDYIGGYDFVIARASSTDTIRLGTLEGIASCTTGDNPGTAWVDVLVRQ